MIATCKICGRDTNIAFQQEDGSCHCMACEYERRTPNLKRALPENTGSSIVFEKKATPIKPVKKKSLLDFHTPNLKHALPENTGPSIVFEKKATPIKPVKKKSLLDF